MKTQLKLVGSSVLLLKEAWATRKEESSLVKKRQGKHNCDSIIPDEV